MKRSALYLFLCWIALPVFPLTVNESLGQLMHDFLSTDWPTVLTAKEKIENLGPAGIEDIIAVMNDCRVHELQNTGDLIFPGAEKYFGHGQIIDYDIDDICVRAGWLLEDLTFMNFGFTGIHLPDAELSDFIVHNFPEYNSIPANQRQMQELSVTGKRKLIRTLSIERVKSWWKTAAAGWTRLEALEEALNSNDEKCQVKALFYMRNGKTSCRGLNEQFYKSNLEPVIMKLSKVETGRVSENAKLVMLDSDFDWLALKPVD
jgi:hypothetical protein